MNRDETTQVLAMVTALDRRTVGQADLAAWGAVLDGVSLDDAKAAVVRHFREKPGVWCEPGHVWALARDIRRERAAAMSPDERLAAAVERDRARGLEAPELDAVVPDEVRAQRVSHIRAFAQGTRIPGEAS